LLLGLEVFLWKLGLCRTFGCIVFLGGETGLSLAVLEDLVLGEGGLKVFLTC
jgi:hypothetical protein